MTGGGTSRSRILRSSVLPSVSSAFRVSSGRRRGSLDLDDHVRDLLPTGDPQCQPTPSPPARECLPRLALISQLTPMSTGGVFLSVGGRSAAGVIYETYLVG
jgi:hypothetical protein